MKKIILTALVIMMSSELTHPISNGAIAAITFIPLVIITGVIVHKNNKTKREHYKVIEVKQALITDLKNCKKEKKEHKLQLRRLEGHNQKNSIEAREQRLKIERLKLTIEDLEDQIEALH